MNGPLEFGHCNACQSDIPISHDFWIGIFSDILTEILTELEEGFGRNSTIFGEFHTRLRYAYLKPKCSNCQEPYDIKEIREAKDYELKCSSCGEKVTILLLLLNG
ncbi:MAG: hypothetical protein GF308_14760 [Candidatus Heimdallarchaeota archaeon]|nr:hypothetical protein [Candidatus Heimdallarchaeota archaeon]